MRLFAAFCAALRLPQWAMMLEPIVRVVVMHCKSGCSLDARQRFAGTSTLTVGMPPPTRAMTASDGSRVGFDSR
jgi:hypothetical protein